MDLPIVVEGVSKRYQLGASHQAALKERLEWAVRAPLSRLRGAEVPEEPQDTQEFWALRDISFEVQPGEVLGLIGANGAGKSTLLKLLARITLPSEGRVTMRGRVGSLLEVGSGFHPELTGRENVYLNGAVLGMRRREIAKIYDEIVEFSGIERFMETPVKRYSSGMFVRLAFAVAAHLNTDILLIDEVLSVGDAEFQRRSLGKMNAAAAAGRTVVFVSHGLSSVERLCDRALWLDKGRIAADGSPSEAIGEYLQGVGPEQAHGTATVEDEMLRQGSGDARLREISLLGSDGRPAEQAEVGEKLHFSIDVEALKPIPDAVIELGISSPDAVRVVTLHSTDYGGSPTPLQRGRTEVVAELDTELLPGEFNVDLGIHSADGLTHDFVEGVLSFRVENPEHGPGGYPFQAVRGSVRTRSHWHVAATGSEPDPEPTPAP